MHEEFHLPFAYIVDRFKIIQALGSGGMGRVYLAVDIESGKDVAIKVLPKEHPFYHLWIDHFRREEEIYQKIDHPNVVGFIASGEGENFHYLVLEHILGMSMRMKLDREGPSGTISTFSWMEDLFLALHAAHEVGCIHRDIKPENIMLTKDLDIKLIDFGIGRFAPIDASFQFAESDLVGTLLYSAPEVIKRQAISKKADIYSAGLVFYELLTGQSLIRDPYDREGVIQEMEHIDSMNSILPKREEGPLYEEMDKLICQMLRYSSKDRIESTGAILNRMEEISEAIGGALQTLRNEESKKNAQKKIARNHYEKARALLDRGEFIQAVKELGKQASFFRNLDERDGRKLEVELDMFLLNVKGEGRRAADPLSVWPDELFTVVDSLLEICRKLMPPYELYIREYIVYRRMNANLDVADMERFLQWQVLHRPRSYVFNSAYCRMICRISRSIAKEVWIRFLNRLLKSGILCQASQEIRDIESYLGPDVLSEETLDLHEDLFSKQMAERADFKELMEKLEKTRDTNQVIVACESFLTHHPQSVATMLKLRDALLAADRDKEAIDVELRIGAVKLQCNEIEDAEKVFLRILRNNETKHRAALFLYACLLAKDAAPTMGSPSYPRDEKKLLSVLKENYSNTFTHSYENRG